MSDAYKTNLFELFKQNPKKNDHRTLAQQFRVSIERIKAIIRQKELELDLASKGKVIEKDFLSVIESNLECVDNSDEVSQHKYQSKKLPFRPTFVCVPEGRNFNFQDSKNVFIASGINIKSPSFDSNHALKGDLNEFSNENVKIIDHSPFEMTRSKFVFVNMKKTKSADGSNIIVRDVNGNLRTATREEKENAFDKTWNRNRPKVN